MKSNELTSFFFSFPLATGFPQFRQQQQELALRREEEEGKVTTRAPPQPAQLNEPQDDQSNRCLDLVHGTFVCDKNIIPCVAWCDTFVDCRDGRDEIEKVCHSWNQKRQELKRKFFNEN